MNAPGAFKSQYHAGLKTLRLAVEACPDSKWNDERDGFSAFWRVVYHTLFFTHWYAQKDRQSFVRWSRHRQDAYCLANDKEDVDRHPHMCETFTREDILEYLNFCDKAIDGWVDALDFSAAQSGFPGYEMSKLEHQIVNIRHLQNHAAALASRLRREANIEVPWVGEGDI